jgi:ATP-dependent Clp protease ATP-binding subunit ClpC
MTSNIGARFIQKRATLGFQTSEDASIEKMQEQVLSEVKRTFAPEFINRLDEIIVFDELTDEDLMQIIDLQIGMLNDILQAHDLQVKLTTEAKQWLIDKTCPDRSYGARPLRRALQKYVEDELSESLIQGEFEGKELVEIDCKEDKLSLFPKSPKKVKNAVTS